MKKDLNADVNGASKDISSGETYKRRAGDDAISEEELAEFGLGREWADFAGMPLVNDFWQQLTPQSVMTPICV